MRREFIPRSDSREHQKLGGIESSATQDDLARGKCSAYLTGIRVSVFVGSVETSPLEILDSNRSIGVVEQNTRRKCIEFYMQSLRLLPRHRKDAFASPHAACRSLFEGDTVLRRHSPLPIANRSGRIRPSIASAGGHVCCPFSRTPSMRRE